jgi:hypothetical protein
MNLKTYLTGLWPLFVMSLVTSVIRSPSAHHVYQAKLRKMQKRKNHLMYLQLTQWRKEEK